MWQSGSQYEVNLILEKFISMRSFKSSTDEQLSYEPTIVEVERVDL